MKLRVYSAIFVAAMALALAIPAPAETVDISITGWSDYTTPSGIPVGPYILTTSEGVDIVGICNDYVHQVAPGQVWTAEILTFDNLSGARFWDASDALGSLERYRQAAYLLSVLLELDPGDGDNIVALNLAVWSLFSPTDDGLLADVAGFSDPSLVAYWRGLARPGDFDFSAFRVLTPTGDDGQEQILVPEPASLTMMGAGLALASFRRRKASVKTLEI